MTPLDDIDRKLIHVLQDGLPLVSDPWQVVADETGITAGEVMDRVQAMIDEGSIRRIAAVPNHYRVGTTANGMSVWDVADEHVEEIGQLVGAISFVSHCYCRPRRLPDWPYNLFAMVHGPSREEVEKKVAQIADLINAKARSRDILYSTRILKKTGLRFVA